jgi:hypothetical protein
MSNLLQPRSRDGIFDKAYIDFAHLADLSMREVFRVSRAKENLKFKVCMRYQSGAAQSSP